jgi:inosine/xanthosine triphosphate pyrophosphatase family protein
MPDGCSFFFTVTCHVTMCEKGEGVGAIDPFTIPDGSDKPYSEMSEAERAALHARGELARLIVAKLHELGY